MQGSLIGHGAAIKPGYAWNGKADSRLKGFRIAPRAVDTTTVSPVHHQSNADTPDQTVSVDALVEDVLAHTAQLKKVIRQEIDQLYAETGMV